MRVSLVLLAAAAGAAPAAAQGDHLAPVVLRLPGSTRGLGLGNAFVAGRGAEVVFYNPAQMLVRTGTALSVQRIGSASTLGTLATVGALGTVGIGVGVQHLDYETTPSAFWFSPPPALTVPGPIASSSLAATVAAATRWKGLRIGIGVKYLSEQIGTDRDRSVALDVGLAREVGRTTVAVAVQNLGGDLEVGGVGADLPFRVTAGLAPPAIRLGSFVDFIATAAVSVERDGRVLPGGGLELLFEPVSGWTVSGRAGIRRRDELPLESTWGPTAGASFGLDRFSLDYGFEPTHGRGSSHRVGIRIQ